MASRLVGLRPTCAMPAVAGESCQFPLHPTRASQARPDQACVGRADGRVGQPPVGPRSAGNSGMSGRHFFAPVAAQHGWILFQIKAFSRTARAHTRSMQPSEHENNTEMEQKTTVMGGHCPFLLLWTKRDSAPREGAETRRTPAMPIKLAEREKGKNHPAPPSFRAE